MKVSNADALMQREKRAADEKQSLIAKRRTLKGIFMGCVLSSALLAGSCIGDATKQSSVSTTNTQDHQTTGDVSARNYAGKGLLMVGFLLGGTLALSGLPKVNRRLRSVERRQQILSFKG